MDVHTPSTCTRPHLTLTHGHAHTVVSHPHERARVHLHTRAATHPLSPASSARWCTNAHAHSHSDVALVACCQPPSPTHCHCLAWLRLARLEPSSASAGQHTRDVYAAVSGGRPAARYGDSLAREHRCMPRIAVCMWRRLWKCLCRARVYCEGVEV